MKQKYRYVLQCTGCDARKEFDTYNSRHVCPHCHGEMILIEMHPDLSQTELIKEIKKLLAVSHTGDRSARLTLALLSDNPDPVIRNMVEQERYEHSRRRKCQPESTSSVSSEISISVTSEELYYAPKHNSETASQQIDPGQSSSVGKQLKSYRGRRHKTYFMDCSCGLTIEYPSIMSGTIIQECPNPACKIPLQIPGRLKKRYDCSDMITFSASKGGLVIENKTDKSLYPLTQQHLPLAEKIYHGQKPKKGVVFWSIITLSVLFVLLKFSFFSVLLLLAVIIIAKIVCSAKKTDLLRGLSPFLTYRNNTNSTDDFADFLSFFFDNLAITDIQNISLNNKNTPGFGKQKTDAQHNFSFYKFGEDIQMLVYPEQAVLLLKNKLHIMGVNSMELSISEHISFSSQLSNFTERWRYQRLNGKPDKRYKDNYRIKQPANCEYHANISYQYRLVIDGIRFTGTGTDAAVVNKIVSKWNNASF